MKAVLLAMLVVAGCKSQEPPKPADCDKLVPPAIDRIMADYKSDPRVVAVIDQAKSEMTALCRNDKWSGRVGACIAASNTRAEMDQCRAGLEPDQAQHVRDANARLRGAIEQSGAKAPEAPAVGSGSAGSGTGSGSE
jgi:hypothetical protein